MIKWESYFKQDAQVHFLQYSCADYAQVGYKPEAESEEHNDFLQLSDFEPQVHFIMSLSVCVCLG